MGACVGLAVHRRRLRGRRAQQARRAQSRGHGRAAFSRTAGQPGHGRRETPYVTRSAGGGIVSAGGALGTQRFRRTCTRGRPGRVLPMSYRCLSDGIDPHTGTVGRRSGGFYRAGQTSRLPSGRRRGGYVRACGERTRTERTRY